ncbi:MAG TPA: hypothetical protein VFC46_13280 [Humisphaera sp.]|nr:hypothetical protein [Humisphaera sp.]
MAYDRKSIAEREGGRYAMTPVTCFWMDEDEFDRVSVRLSEFDEEEGEDKDGTKYQWLIHCEELQWLYDEYHVIGGNILLKRGRLPLGTVGPDLPPRWEPPWMAHDGCLLICEDVLSNYSKSRQVIYGVVDNIVARSMPAEVGPFSAYIRTGSGVRDGTIILSISNAEKDEEILKFEAAIPDGDVRALVLKIPVFTVTEPGPYVFQATCKGRPFAEAPVRILVADVEE